jgi:hypothetical protein
MPDVTISPPAKFSSSDILGAPLVGGLLYTYLAGTSTPYATYTDQTGTIANANPVVLDARGEANVWLEQGVAYKFALHDALDNLIWTVDNINAAPGGGATGLFGNGTVAAPSISFLNSTGMGFYRISNNVLGVATAGANAMAIDASQNVGIGIASPTVRLDVVGAGKFSTGLTVAAGGLTVTTGGITASGTTSITGATTITGNTTVAGGTFASRGFADNATAAAWNIDSTGRLLNNGTTQPAFAAFRATSQQTSGTTLIFNTEQFDTGSNYNASTGVFTAPVAGIYSFSASAQFTNSTGANLGAQMRIQCSSAGDVAGSSFLYANGVTFSVSTSVVVRLNAGETVQVILNSALSGLFVLDTQAYSRFSGALLY